MPQPDYINALDLPVEEPKDKGLKAYFDKCREKLGFVPTVLQAYAWRPQRLQNFIDYSEELLRGEQGLSRIEREMIAVVVSSANHCYNCLVSHGQAVRFFADDPELGEMLVMNYRSAPLEPRQRAMLDFAWKLTETPDRVGESDRDVLRANGFSEEDIFDIICVVGFFNMTNRIATATGQMPNREYHKMNR